MKAKTTTRHGKHIEDKVQFGGMVTPEFKALAQLTASMCECSMMQLMMDGVTYYATSKGIMRNGKIVSEYKQTIEAMADIIRANLRNTRKGK